MRVKVTANPITPFGSFSRGDILDSKKYPESFLHHLVYEAGAAELLDYEKKVIEIPETKKKELTTKDLPPTPERQTTTKKKSTKKKRSSSSRRGQV